MPMIRRCPKCGDDLSTEEEVCVFCGHRLGRAGVWERIKLNADDWIRVGAALVVVYFVAPNVALWALGVVAPDLKEAALARPGLERALRWGIVAATAAVIGAAVWRDSRKRLE